jgi:hypothetical protein
MALSPSLSVNPPTKSLGPWRQDVLEKIIVNKIIPSEKIFFFIDDPVMA